MVAKELVEGEESVDSNLGFKESPVSVFTLLLLLLFVLLLWKLILVEANDVIDGECDSFELDVLESNEELVADDIVVEGDELLLFILQLKFDNNESSFGLKNPELIVWYEEEGGACCFCCKFELLFFSNVLSIKNNVQKYKYVYF